MRTYVCENCGESKESVGQRGRLPKKCLECRKKLAKVKRDQKKLIVQTTKVIANA